MEVWIWEALTGFVDVFLVFCICWPAFGAPKIRISRIRPVLVVILVGVGIISPVF